MVYKDPTLKHALSLIQSYNEYAERADECITKSVVMDGMPKGNLPGDPIFSAMLQREYYRERMAVVEKAICSIPPQYREEVWDTAVNGVPVYKLKRKHGSTAIAKYKKLFILAVASSAKNYM